MNKEDALEQLNCGELFTLLSSKKSIIDIEEDFDRASPAELLILENQGYTSQIKLEKPDKSKMSILSKNNEAIKGLKDLKRFLDSLDPETKDRLLESVLSQIGSTPTFEQLLTIQLIRGDKDKYQEYLSEDDYKTDELLMEYYGRINS